MGELNNLKTEERVKLEKFFGTDLKMSSGNYFSFRRVIDKDHIIILTNNLTMIKDKNILMLSPKEGVYIPSFQIRKVYSHQAGIKAYAVKLDRKYFNPFAFRYERKFYSGDETTETFESLMKLAKIQESENIKVKVGWPKSSR